MRLKIQEKIIITIFFTLTVVFVGIYSVYLSSIEKYFCQQFEKTYHREILEVKKIFLEFYSYPEESNKINHFIDKIRHITAKRITIIDKQGNVLVETMDNIDTTEKYLQSEEVMDAFHNGFGVRKEFYERTQYKLFMAVKVVHREFHGVIRMVIEDSEVQVNIQKIDRLVNIIFILPFVLSMFLSILISSMFTKRIKLITSVARSIADGDYSKTVKIKTKDEIGDLASIINDLSSQIKIKIEEIKKLEKIQMDFIANASHELRTPISNIRGYSETLLEELGSKSDHSEKFLSIIHSNSEKMSFFLDELFDLARLDSRELELNIKDCDIEKLIDKVVLDLEKDIDEKGILFTKNIPEKLTNIKADNLSLYRIFFNLIENAIKYNKEGGWVTVSVFERAENIQMDIEDSGLGIPVEDAPFIFESFYRVKQSSLEVTGTGLGLAIVKKLIDLHGGKVDVSSKLNKGSVFSLFLPLD